MIFPLIGDTRPPLHHFENRPTSSGRSCLPKRGMPDTSTARCHVAAVEREIPHGCGKYIVGDLGESRDAAGTWKANNGLGAWVDVEGIGLVEMWEVEQRDQQLAVASNCDVLEESAFGVMAPMIFPVMPGCVHERN